MSCFGGRASKVGRWGNASSETPIVAGFQGIRYLYIQLDFHTYVSSLRFVASVEHMQSITTDSICPSNNKKKNKKTNHDSSRPIKFSCFLAPPIYEHTPLEFDNEEMRTTGSALGLSEIVRVEVYIMPTLPT